MKRNVQNGFTLMEMLVAVVVTAALAVIAAQLLVLAVQQRHVSKRRVAAVTEVANLMERVAALDYRDVTAENVKEIRLSAEALRLLPNAELQIDVTKAQGEVPGKRIAIELSWQNRAGQRGAPVRLTAWRYAAAEAER